MHKISKLTLTETFNLGCDIDLEHSNSTFPFAYDDLHSNWVWLQKTHWFRTNKIFWLYKPTLWPWPWRENQIFSYDIPAHDGAPQCQVCLQKIANTQPSGNKYMSQVLHPSPLKIPQYFPFSSEIIHHTQRKKRSNVAATSQLMWSGTLGLVKSQWYKQKYFVCLHVTPL